MGERTTTTVQTTEGLKDLPGFTTPVEGLTLTDVGSFNNAHRGYWQITHVRSGLAVASSQNIEQLAAVVLDLAAVGVDWTGTLDSLMSAADIEGAIYLSCDKWGAIAGSVTHAKGSWKDDLHA